MSEVKRVSDETLQSLQQMQEHVSNLVFRYGELHLQKRVIEAEIESVESALSELDEQRKETTQKLQEEFGGTGTINLATGEFIPD